MGSWLEKLIGGGRSTGPLQPVRSFGPSDIPLTIDAISRDGDSWKIEVNEERSVALFELSEPGVEGCLLAYRASLKTTDASGIYLEMWCQLPGQGEFFSKGIDQIVKGTTDWSSREIPFRLKKGQRPDLIRLNIAFTGKGAAWMKDIELLRS